MLNMDVENQSVLFRPNGSASEQEKEPVPLTQRLLSACYQHKKAITGMIISGLVLCSVFLGLRILMSLNCPSITCPSVTSPSGTCPSVTCPPDWIGHQRHCYKFSDKDKNWNESQNFCMSHNASLAKITEEEMDFVKKFTRDNVFWIGLKKELDQLWKWLDGENSTLEVMGNGGDCAYLDGGAKANSGRCTTEHHYICKKN
ncbi:C-type lectin domain family 2 member B-like [Ahaetulla prasina]|uniref:C-type lectin domain family 2 member B-like n=1 Tax=Ahaetulla prasina TaxID=499056 RepID=UPI00264945C6|nr:C-type lectin domain family 2 member B-like [Ahaetulla prasina]